MKKPTFRAAMLSLAVCTAAACPSFAQMAGDQPSMADHAKSMAGDAKSMAGGMQADQQAMEALQKIKAAGPEKAGDMMFVLENGMGNAFEAAFSKLVESKSQDPKIKELTKMVETDHMQANEKLKGIAEKLGVTLPAGLPSLKQAKLDAMAALPPAELDKMYLMQQRALHAQDVTMFEDHLPMAKDEALKAYIKEVTPKLQEHAMHINMVAKDKGAASDQKTPADAAGKM